MRLTPELQEWWYSRLPKSMVALNHTPSVSFIEDKR
jgi:hypothetical protein